MENKKEILGQYFTKTEIVEKLLDLLFSYKKYSKKISILEPSFGTGNFIKELKTNPADFFQTSIEDKFDLIVGNPPFTKYNLKDSYYYASKYKESEIKPELYLDFSDIKNDKQKIENAFIFKSLRQLKDNNSSIGFVLPISFFIKNRNMFVKNKLREIFSTIVIYQNDKVWFDRNIPCCFALFTNTTEFKDKIIVIYENGKKNEDVFNISNINEELIPQVIFNKNHGLINNEKGIPLRDYFSSNNIKAQKSFKDKICQNINSKIDYFRNITCRVGSKSIKKENIYDFKVEV